MGTTEILLAALVLLLLLYYYLTSNYDFWEKKKVRGPRPVPIFGTMSDIFLGKTGLGLYATKVYETYPDEPVVGVYSLREPILLIRDLNLIKTILIKDFSNFVNRSMEFDQKHDPLMANLFFLNAQLWKPLRAKLTPVFTSGKLKEMFYLLNKCGDQLDNQLNKLNGRVVDLREITGKFTTEVIGMCAFGVDANSFGEDESAFIKMGKRIFQPNFKAFFKFIFRQFSPLLYRLLGGFLKDDILDSFFINLARDTMEYREKNNIMRHDFIDLMRGLRKEPQQLGEDVELTDSLVAAQLTVFFVGGSETSSTTISNCLFELAMNSNIQTKLRDEIKMELEKADGVITYEALNSMKYLDKVFNETLRKYPPVGILTRKSERDYTLPGSNVSIPKDTKVWIPVFGIHRDEKYYPNPSVFDPERFSEEQVKERDSTAFLPFGEGPRNCIGARFGKIQTKYGIVKILQNYIVETCDKTDKEYKISPRTMFLTPLNGIHLRIIKAPIMY